MCARHNYQLAAALSWINRKWNENLKYEKKSKKKKKGAIWHGMKLKWKVGMGKLCSMHIIDVIRDLKKRNTHTHTKNLQFSSIVISSLVGVLFCVCECVRHAVLSLQRWWCWQHVPLSPIESLEDSCFWNEDDDDDVIDWKFNICSDISREHQGNSKNWNQVSHRWHNRIRMKFHLRNQRKD